MRHFLACSVLVGLGLGLGLVGVGCSGTVAPEEDAGTDAARADGGAPRDGSAGSDGGGGDDAGGGGDDAGGGGDDAGGGGDDAGGGGDDAGGGGDDAGGGGDDAGGGGDDAGGGGIDAGGTTDAGGGIDAGGAGDDAGAGAGDGGSRVDGGRRSCGPAAPCLGLTQFCDTPPGMCGGNGECTPVPGPVDCNRIVAPVCGCDGMTYTNDCLAARARVSVDHVGACGACRSNADCAPTEYCSTPDGMCSAEGLCTARPDACTTVCDPECGCDGTTYLNACTREQAGVGLGSAGICPGSADPCSTGVICCSSDLGCPRAQECVGPAGLMVCKSRPRTGLCWDDGDCGPGTTCMGARVCGCHQTCFAPDAPGTCG